MDVDEDLLKWETAYKEFVDTSTHFFMGFDFLPSRFAYVLKLVEAEYSRIGFTANLGVELASSGGIKLNDFIMSCRFIGRNCDINESFVTFFLSILFQLPHFPASG